MVFFRGKSLEQLQAMDSATLKILLPDEAKGIAKKFLNAFVEEWNAYKALPRMNSERLQKHLVAFPTFERSEGGTHYGAFVRSR